MGRVYSRVVVALVLSILAAGWARGSVIVPIDGVGPDGRTYGQLAEDWWQWALATPEASSPLVDQFGDFAGEGQAGDVFYLAPSIGGGGDFTRSIVLPEGKWLFIPVVTSVVFNGPEETYTDAEMRQQLAEFNGKTSILYATIDGEQVLDVWSYRASTGVGGFEVTLPEGNIFGLDPGTYGPPAVADGWWLLMEPLAVGEHVIRFEGGTGDPNESEYYQGVTYNVVVVPEPAALGLVGVAMLMVLRRRR